MANKNQAETQKNQQVMNFTEDQARTHIEAIRWPNGPTCPHCGGIDVYRMEGKTTRRGLLACRTCRGHFTVMVGTVMEDSKLPLATWLRAFHMLTSSKKGMSALQLQRNLGLGSYRTAWFLAHRVREAMRCEPVAEKLKGDVQVDETYVGANRNGKTKAAGEKSAKRGRGTEKTPVMVLVETNGNAHSEPMQRVDIQSLKAAMESHVDPSARIVTDELNSYPKAARGFAGGHSTVCHSAGEYVNEEGFHTNTAESYFSLLKRGVYGTFHHVSKKHLHRYCNEFSFRWNEKTAKDAQRRDKAVYGAEGKRLFYKTPKFAFGIPMNALTERRAGD